MRKRLVLSMLLSLFLFLLISPTYAQVVFSDDFSGDLSKWTVATAGTWAIESSELSGDNDAGTEWYKIMTLASFSGYRVLEAKVVFKGWYAYENVACQRVGIIIQKNPSHLTHDWCLVIRGDNTLNLLDENVVWGPNIPFTPVENTVYRMKMMYDGTYVKGKCWVDGDPEPDWQLSAEWTDTVSDARIGLYVAYAHAHFDDVSAEDNNNPGNPGVPEFGVELPAMTSIALAAYTLVKRQLFKKRE